MCVNVFQCKECKQTAASDVVAVVCCFVIDVAVVAPNALYAHTRTYTPPPPLMFHRDIHTHTQTSNEVVSIYSSTVYVVSYSLYIYIYI